MTFRITALDPLPFAPLSSLTDSELAAQGAVRRTMTEHPGTPCRVSLEDAAIGETVLLIDFEHLAVASPFRARHAIFVRPGVARAEPEPGEVPPVIARRLISARAYDGAGMMIDADVVEGVDVAALLDRLFGNSATTFIDLHNARPGSFAARAVRA